MRKIEKQMLAAIASHKNWRSGNTSVTANANGTCDVYLHGHHIANMSGTTGVVNLWTLYQWPTVTTKSRLRALGFDVYTRNYVTYCDGHAVHDMSNAA